MSIDDLIRKVEAGIANGGMTPHDTRALAEKIVHDGLEPNDILASLPFTEIEMKDPKTMYGLLREALERGRVEAIHEAPLAQLLQAFDQQFIKIQKVRAILEEMIEGTPTSYVRDTRVKNALAVLNTVGTATVEAPTKPEVSITRNGLDRSYGIVEALELTIAGNTTDNGRLEDIEQKSDNTASMLAMLIRQLFDNGAIDLRHLRHHLSDFNVKGA